jgi:hypothetical protein
MWDFVWSNPRAPPLEQDVRLNYSIAKRYGSKKPNETEL